MHSRERKVSFFVTHHLGMVRFADLIIVLDKGHLIEAGSHDELMERNGKYHELWSLQASSYVFGTEASNVKALK